MSSNPLSYFTIQELNITFKDAKRISESLKLVAGSTERTVTTKRKDGLTHCWLLDPVVNVPSEEDLAVKPGYLNELVVTGKELHECNNNSGRITKQGSDYNLEIVATAHGIFAKSVHANMSARHIKDTLKPVSLAKLGERCMDGTRVDQLTTIREWIADHQRPNIFVIYGGPGTGKSTISSTLAFEIPQKYPCARFFFRRDEGDRRDPTLVWPTVAFELASLDRNMELGILEVLTFLTDALHVDVREQFEVLIREPLTKERQPVAPVAPFILVLDALDECSQGTVQWSKFLRTLRLWSELPRHFKLIITSRHDSTIHKTLDGVSEQIQLLSGADVDTPTSRDIERFIAVRFKEISSQFPSSISSSWPGPAKIQQLVDYAAGLFVLANTMLDWIGERDPEDRLSQIGDNLGEAEANLDRLYRQILTTATHGLKETELNGFTTALSAIVLAKDPLSRADLNTLFQLSGPSMELIMRNLTVVVSTQSSRFQVHDKSFSDFLLDPKRSERFTIDYETQSVAFASACLRYMNAHLRFNMFNVKTSHRFNKDISDYDEICRSIPTPMIYSSHYWAEYLEGLIAKPSHGPVEPSELESFIQNHMLHWFEVLSLTKAIRLAPQLLMLASSYIRGCNTSLSELATDGSKFAMTFQEPISQSLPHIYVSALAFAPMESLVAKKMCPLFSNSLSIVKGRTRDWSAISLERYHESGFKSVELSLDGTRAVFGSSDGTICVWDVDTDKCIVEPFEVHEELVGSVAFSPDGARFVSVDNDGILRVWNTNTGKSLMEPVRAHEDWAWSVAFSPDGTYIVSGSYDKTIRIWDADTGKSNMEPLRGHEDAIYCMVLSADGTRIASGSQDKTIRVWDAHTGKSIMEPLQGHEDAVYSVAFSPDGTRIVSGSQDKTIRIWDAHTGKSIMEPLRGHEDRILALAFSADGTRIVSAAYDKTIRVWDADTGKTVMEPLRGHGISFLFVALSADGTRIVSGSDTIRWWDVDTSRSLKEPFRGHESGIRIVSVTFSADGTRILSGSETDDKTSHIDTVIPHCCFAFQDARGVPAFCSHSELKDGWLYDAHGNILFWVPPINRRGLYYPRTTRVIGAGATQLDLSWFVHGEHWTEICSSSMTQSAEPK